MNLARFIRKYMIKWYKNLYVGENAKKRERKIRYDLEMGKSLPGIYLITYADNHNNQLEIFPAIMLKRKTAHNACPVIIGIAVGHREAVKLVTALADTAYRIECCKSIRSYLENRE